MNLPDSEEIKFFRRRARSDDGDTSDSENDSVEND
jgi:hypothetical protein